MPVDNCIKQNHFEFKEGPNQTFPELLIDMDKIEKCGKKAGKIYYPMVIQIDALGVERSSHFVYCEFQEEEDKLDITILKQKSIVGKSVYELKEVYGMEKEEALNLCCICLSRPRTTMLIPCRHTCLCPECAEQLREKNPWCPICRTAVKSCLTVKRKSSTLQIQHQHLKILHIVACFTYISVQQI